MNDNYYKKLTEAVYEYKEDEFVKELVKEALCSGLDAMAIIDNGLLPGINKISENYSAGKAYLPELMLSANVMRAALSILDPEIRKNSQKRKTLGRAIIGTVKGDVHDVGKNIVIMMMEIGGFEVFDLGIDVAAEGFIEAIDKYEPQIVGTGAFLSATVEEQKNVLDAIIKHKKRDKIKLVGK